MNDEDEEYENFEVSDYDILSAFNPYANRHKMTREESVYGIWAENEEVKRQRKQFKGYTEPVTFISGGLVKDDKKSDEDDNIPVTDSSDSDDGRNNTYVRKPINSVTVSSVATNKIGYWEKHTKGIGMKLLLKMGYEKGKGLGKDLQGRSIPIEAVKRKGKAAMGAYGPEGFKDDRVAEVANEVTGRRKNQQWLKSDKNTAPHYKVKSAADLLSSKDTVLSLKQERVDLPKMRIIDMTGKEKKVYESFEELNRENLRAKDDFDMKKNCDSLGVKELMINLDFLIQRTEQKLIHADKQLNHAENIIVNMQYERNKLDRCLEDEVNELNRSEEVLKIISNIEEGKLKTEKPQYFLAFMMKTFNLLKNNFYEEYKMYGLDDLIFVYVSPSLAEIVNEANLIQEKQVLLEEFVKWKDALDTKSTLKSNQSMEPYHRLVWEVLLPVIRKFILGWNPREPDEFVDFIDLWRTAFPPWILENIYEQLLIPKIQTALDDWNPLTDRIPVHVWIHPWLPFIHDKLDSLYITIRHKLSNALVNWHPSDSSAKLILLPWRHVFSESVWDSFMIKNIVPKLRFTMNEFVINPANQYLAPWEWVFSWFEIVPDICLVQILERNFFPKFLQTLNNWLCSTPDFEEIGRWFSGWKSMIPAPLQSHPGVKHYLIESLNMLNRTAPKGPRDFEHFEIPLHHPTMSGQPSRNYNFYGQNRGFGSNYTLDQENSISFKDVVEKKASECNIIFMPVHGRFFEGKQVYRFGNVNIFIEKNITYILHNGRWNPISLNELIRKAL